MEHIPVKSIHVAQKCSVLELPSLCVQLSQIAMLSMIVEHLNSTQLKKMIF